MDAQRIIYKSFQEKHSTARQAWKHDAYESSTFASPIFFSTSWPHNGDTISKWDISTKKLRDFQELIFMLKNAQHIDSTVVFSIFVGTLSWHKKFMV